MSIDQKKAAEEIKGAIDKLSAAVESAHLPLSLELMGLMCIVNRRIGALMAQLAKFESKEAKDDSSTAD